MATDKPGPGAGPDQPEPGAEAPRPPEPTWATPPPPAAPAAGQTPDASSGAPQPPAAQPGAQPPVPQAPGWGAPAPQPGQQPGQWGAPAPQPQQEPAQWGAPAPQPQPQPPQQGSWGSPQPPTAQPPAPQAPTPPPGQQPGQWGAPAGGAAPPPGQPTQPGWGGPGQPQPGWQGGPPPAKSSGNGCLKACLIVGVALVVLAIIATIALFAVGSSIVSGLGLDSSGNLKDCQIVSSAQAQTVLGPDTTVAPLSGLANTIGGVALDKRVLPNADNCWIGSGTSPDTSQANGEFGRIAKYSGGDASSVFDQERASAQGGGYFVQDVSGAGDQAFCTGWSDQYTGTGALVRKGSDLVYVSFLIGPGLDFNESSGESGVPYSPQACSDAVSLALLALP